MSVRRTFPSDSCAGVPSSQPRFDLFLDRMFGDGNGFASLATGLSNPPMAIWEDDESVHLEVDLPGVLESNIDVTFHKGLLSIKAERKAAEGRRYLYESRRSEKMERVVRLSDAVSGESIEAKLQDGVLRLTLDKALEVRPKKIAVTRESAPNT
jgi:HSP20 family protein